MLARLSPTRAMTSGNRSSRGGGVGVRDGCVISASCWVFVSSVYCAARSLAQTKIAYTALVMQKEREDGRRKSTPTGFFPWTTEQLDVRFQPECGATDLPMGLSRRMQ